MTNMVDKVHQITDALNGVRDAQQKLEGVLSGGPASYYFEKLNDCIAGLFSFAKFKIGDRVRLVKDVSPCPMGWAGAEHFLKKNEPAVIDDVDYSKNGFSYGIVFDHESWLNDKEQRILVKSKHQYWFNEKELK